MIRLYASLRLQAGTKEVEIPAASAGTLRLAVESLCREYPVLAEKILDGERVREHFIISVNGMNVQLGKGLDTPLRPDDEVAIFPPIAGGSIK
jgi:molybdopterin synthase sulfur carrier subunit